jgi:HD-GYP domain-containing protein (c-di-GMP phosphodiesterase class II)
LKFLISLLIIYLLPLALYAKSDILNKQEREWVDNHVVKIGIEPWVPVLFINEKGKVDGISGQYIKIITKLTGLKVEFISKDWKALVDDFKDKKIDILPATYKTKKREKYAFFTNHYFKIKNYIFIKESNNHIVSIKDLSHKKLAIKEESGNIEAIRNKFPKIKLILCKSDIETIEKVLSGEADALYASALAIENILREESISGIKGIYQKEFKTPSLHMMIDRDEPILQSIIQKALDAITYSQKEEIISNWIKSYNTIHLTTEEKRWLNEHRVIKFTGDPNWLPFEAFNNKKYIGIMADYLSEVEHILNVDFVKVPSNSWNHALKMLLNSDVDVITESVGSSIMKFVKFTKPILKNNIYIIMEKSNYFVNDLNSLKGKKIVMIENYGYINHLKSRYPDIDFHYVKNIDEGLNGVSIGKYDAMVATSALSSYSMSKLGLNNLKIVGDTKITTEIAWGVRNEYEPLVAILNKALDSLSIKQKNSILNSWVKKQTITITDYTLLFKILAVALLIGAFILFNNYKLKSMVREKTVELRELLDSFVELIAGAIDAKSNYTGAHCAKVPELTMMLCKVASASKAEAFKDFHLDGEDELRELKIASLLHDCGKVTTPEYIVDKATKLETIYNRIHEVRTRFEVIHRDLTIDALNRKLLGENVEVVEKWLKNEHQKLIQEYEVVANANVGSEFMKDEDIDAIREIAKKTWVRNFDDTLGLAHEEKLRVLAEKTTTPATEQLLSNKLRHIIPRVNFDFEAYKKFGFKTKVPKDLYNLGELSNLSISSGTLNHEDRFKIQEHIIMTIKMLEGLPFPKNLKNVPLYAGAHHETLIGTGYPRQLKKEELPLPARIMAIADVFEALTASDRPYKEAKTLSSSIKILSFMVKDKHLDEDLFKLFLSSGVYKEYALKRLKKEQIDEVDISIYL